MKKVLLFLCICLFSINEGKAQNRYSTPIQGTPRNTYGPQHVGLPLETMERVLRAKQEAYDMSINECRKQVVELYNSASSYPEIKDGKHSVTITGTGMCTETTVIVDKGRVFSMPAGNGYITNFSLSTEVKGARSKIGFPDSETGVTRYYDVVFLSDIFSQ